MMRPRRCGSGIRLALGMAFGLAWFGFSAREARAQASDPELRPTRGPLITGAARAGDADATAVELNPGALGLLPAESFELIGAVADDGTTIPRRGAGVYWATPFFGHSALGLGLTPVSYTHLRAHETGRNLVCRLLLEK